MSYAEVYFFNEAGDYETHRCRNAAGLMPILWNTVQALYGDLDLFEADDVPDPHLRDLLNLVKTEPRLLERKWFTWLADLIETEILPHARKHVNHWPEAIKLLRLHAQDDDIVGCGFYANSQNRNHWFVQVRSGGTMPRDIFTEIPRYVPGVGTTTPLEG